MEFRKIIKFGNSSHVISIPKYWLEKNNLNKGDLVYLEENGNGELILNSGGEKRKADIKKIVINIDNKNPERITRELISSYLNGYNIVKIVGKDIPSNVEKIKEDLQYLIAFEIIDQTKEEITIKDLLKTEDISIKDLIRRMDNIARAIISDLVLLPKKKYLEDIAIRDQAINRIYFAIVRTIRMVLNDPNLTKTIELEPTELSRYWNLSHNIESFVDEIKRLNERFKKAKIDKRLAKNLTDIFSKIKESYEEAIKSFYLDDKERAYKISDIKIELLEECSKLAKKNWNKKEIPAIAEIIKNMAFLLHEMTRRVYS